MEGLNTQSVSLVIRSLPDGTNVSANGSAAGKLNKACMLLLETDESNAVNCTAKKNLTGVLLSSWSLAPDVSAVVA